MNEYIVSPSAARDMDEMANWFDDNAPNLAEKTFAALRRHFQLLARFPGMGRARPELARNLRSFPVRPYVIFFRQSATGVEIARVIHGRRNITPDMFAES